MTTIPKAPGPRWTILYRCYGVDSTRNLIARQPELQCTGQRTGQVSCLHAVLCTIVASVTPSTSTNQFGPSGTMRTDALVLTDRGAHAFAVLL